MPRRAPRSFIAALVIFLGTKAAIGQVPCDQAELNLIFQDVPAAGPRFTSRELFAFRTEEVTVPAPAGRIGSTAVFVSQLEGPGGVQAWALGGVADGEIRLGDVTIDNTAAAPEPEGLSRIGFSLPAVNVAFVPRRPRSAGATPTRMPASTSPTRLACSSTCSSAPRS
jgi:hypothetical protein